MKKYILIAILLNIFTLSGTAQIELYSASIVGMNEEVNPFKDGFLVLSHTSNKNRAITFCERSGAIKWQTKTSLLNDVSDFVVGKNYGFLISYQHIKSVLFSKATSEIPMKIYRYNETGLEENSGNKFEGFFAELNPSGKGKVECDGIFTVNDKLYSYWVVTEDGILNYFLCKMNEDFSHSLVKLKLNVSAIDFRTSVSSKPRLVDFDESHLLYTQTYFDTEKTMSFRLSQINLETLEEAEIYNDVQVEENPISYFRSSDEADRLKKPKSKFNNKTFFQYRCDAVDRQEWTYTSFGTNVTVITSTLDSFYDCVIDNGSVYYYGRHSVDGEKSSGIWIAKVAIDGSDPTIYLNNFIGTDKIQDAKIIGMFLYVNNDAQSVAIKTTEGLYILYPETNKVIELRDSELAGQVINYFTLGDVTMEKNKSVREVSRTFYYQDKVYSVSIPTRGKTNIHIEVFD